MEQPAYELSPLDIVALEALANPFCPIAENGGHYRPEDCLPFCDICESLLIKNASVSVHKKKGDPSTSQTVA